MRPFPNVLSSGAGSPSGSWVSSRVDGSNLLACADGEAFDLEIWIMPAAAAIRRSKERRLVFMNFVSGNCPRKQGGKFQ